MRQINKTAQIMVLREAIKYLAGLLALFTCIVMLGTSIYLIVNDHIIGFLVYSGGTAFSMNSTILFFKSK